MATSHITDFIHSLSAEELKTVKKHIKKSEKNSPENKITVLLMTLTNEPGRKFSDLELGKLLNNKPDTIRVLKSRLFDKAKEALSLDEHFENTNIFNERETIVFTLKKKILLIKSLYRTLNQGRAETINFLLEETIKLSKENEIFDVLIEALIVKKQIKGIRYGISEVKKINTEIAFYDQCFKCIQNAHDAYYKLILNLEFINSLSQKELDQHIRDVIKQLKVDYKKTKAQEVYYYMLFLKLPYLKMKRNSNKQLLYANNY